MEVIGDRRAQLRDAIGRGVAVMTVAQGLDRRLDHVFRGLEIRLTDSQIDDRAPLRLQRLGAGQDLEGAFRADPPHRRGGLEHACLRLQFLAGAGQTYAATSRRGKLTRTPNRPDWPPGALAGAAPSVLTGRRRAG